MDAWLAIIGPDSQDGALGEVRRSIVETGIGSRVRFVLPGLWRAETAAAFADADCLSLVSWSENFGNAAAEAAAVGLPVVVSRRAEVTEWLPMGARHEVRSRGHHDHPFRLGYGPRFPCPAARPISCPRLRFPARLELGCGDSEQLVFIPCSLKITPTMPCRLERGFERWPADALLGCDCEARSSGGDSAMVRPIQSLLPWSALHATSSV
jgi:Glycosyl transferases group 1